MCGRYVLVTPLGHLAGYFHATFSPELESEYRPSWNVPPTRRVLGVTAGEDRGRILSQYRWGLIPVWAKDESFGAHTFNARAETVATKPTFRSAFKSRRAIVPSDAFYEWSHRPEELKQPYLFKRADGEPLAFAGLWEAWRDPARADDPDAWIRSCTIITTDAGEDLGQIHNRQPVILEPTAWDLWLDPEARDRDELEGLLRPSPAGTLVRHRVGKAVGRTGVDGPELAEELVET